MWRAVRFALRGLRRTPATSLCAIACLGLGLGVTTAVWSAVDRAMLQPLPFRDPDRLVNVYLTTPRLDALPMAFPDYLDLAHGTKRFTALAALTSSAGLLALPDNTIRVNVVQATGNVFGMLGIGAERGRMLRPDDDTPGALPVTVLSDELWHQRFGGDPSAVGRAVDVDGAQFTIVGVAPPDLRIPRADAVLRAQLWMPLRFSTLSLTERHLYFVRIVGRLAPGATAAGAQADLTTTFTGIAAAYPFLHGDGVRVSSMTAEALQRVRTPLMLLLGAVGMVLAIAATDVASLLLARGIQRRREVAIRLALGGGRRAAMVPALLESGLLGSVGGLFGLGLAWLGVRTIGGLAEQRVPQLAGLEIDFRVIGFAAVLTMVVALACGALPAWRSVTADPQQALRAGRGGGHRGQHRTLGALVTAEVALSLVLLIGAGLALKGFLRLVRSDPGFDAAGVLTLEATVSPQSYPDNTAVNRFLRPALAALRQLPGVESTGAIHVLPYDKWGSGFNLRYEGQSIDSQTQLPLAELRVATPGFFEVTRQRLLRGRLLLESDDDRSSAPAVAVVNEALVKRDFAGRDPVGARFYISDSDFATIVGVVGDIRNQGPFLPTVPEVYMPYAQAQFPPSYPIMIRTRSGDPSALARAATAAIHRVDSRAAVSNVASMQDVIARSTGQPRFYLAMLVTFAAIAGMLALAGLYGAMTYVVTQRTREIGIRGALGSRALHTVLLVTRQGMGLVGWGVALGLIGSVALRRVVSSLLYGVSPLDAATWVTASVGLALAGLAAVLIPAIRATRVDPVIAIRSE